MKIINYIGLVGLAYFFVAFALSGVNHEGKTFYAKYINLNWKGWTLFVVSLILFSLR